MMSVETVAPAASTITTTPVAEIAQHLAATTVQPGQTQPTPVIVNLTQPAAATPAPVVAPITISPDQLQTFMATQTRLAQLEAESKAREETARAEQVRLLAENGKVQEALSAQRDQSKKDLESERAAKVQSEERAKNYALDGELARVLAAQPLVANGAEQLTKLWRENFIVEPQGNSYNVRTHQFQPVGEFVGAMLGRPEYAHYLRPTAPSGGVGSQGAQGTTPTPAANTTSAPTVVPKNYSEAVILDALARSKEVKDGRLTGGAYVGDNDQIIRQPALGFGLRRQA